MSLSLGVILFLVLTKDIIIAYAIYRFLKTQGLIK